MTTTPAKKQFIDALNKACGLAEVALRQLAQATPPQLDALQASVAAITTAAQKDPSLWASDEASAIRLFAAMQELQQQLAEQHADLKEKLSGLLTHRKASSLYRKARKP